MFLFYCCGAWIYHLKTILIYYLTSPTRQESSHKAVLNPGVNQTMSSSKTLLGKECSRSPWVVAKIHCLVTKLIIAFFCKLISISENKLVQRVLTHHKATCYHLCHIPLIIDSSPVLSAVKERRLYRMRTS